MRIRMKIRQIICILSIRVEKWKWFLFFPVIIFLIRISVSSLGSLKIGATGVPISGWLIVRKCYHFLPIDLHFFWQHFIFLRKKDWWPNFVFEENLILDQGFYILQKVRLFTFPWLKFRSLKFSIFDLTIPIFKIDGQILFLKKIWFWTKVFMFYKKLDYLLSLD